MYKNEAASHVHAVENAILAAEQFCRSEVTPKNLRDALDKITAARDAAYQNYNPQVGHAIEAAFASAKAACDALNISDTYVDFKTAANALHAQDAAAEAAGCAGYNPAIVRAASREDVDRLKELGLGQQPFDPTERGPLGKYWPQIELASDTENSTANENEASQDQPIEINTVSLEITVEQARQILRLHQRNDLANLLPNAELMAKSAAKIVVGDKLSRQAHDVFFCYNEEHQEEAIEVREIALRLRSMGLLPWLNEWDIPPGSSRQIVVESQIRKMNCAAVFLGKNGISTQQRIQIDAFMERECKVIPVLLKSCKTRLELPPFLATKMPIDMRQQEPDPYKLLFWGITEHRLR